MGISRLYVHPRIDAFLLSAHKTQLQPRKANLTKVRDAKPRVLASSEKKWKSPRRTHGEVTIIVSRSDTTLVEGEPVTFFVASTDDIALRNVTLGP